jgi:hypothetical protein
MKFLKLTGTDNAPLYVRPTEIHLISEPVAGAYNAKSMINTALGARYVTESPEEILSLLEQSDKSA